MNPDGNCYVIIHLLACKNNDQIGLIGVDTSEFNNDIKTQALMYTVLFLFKEKLIKTTARLPCKSKEDVGDYIRLHDVTFFATRKAIIVHTYILIHFIVYLHRIS